MFTLVHNIEKIANYAEALARYGIIGKACAAAGISRSCVHEKYKADAASRAAYDEAKECAADMLEAEARRRAMEGVERGIYYKGKRVATDGRGILDGDKPPQGGRARARPPVMFPCSLL